MAAQDRPGLRRAHRLRPYAVTAARTVDNPELTAEVTV
jgi:hypothetical protein